jgi:UDP-N-acetylglucosamine 2-epimerase
MPEEINRIVADRVSRVLFCPTTTAMNNLSREGMGANAHLVGDVMLDTVMMYEHKIAEHSTILRRLQVEEKGFYLATVHRASNTDDPSKLGCILKALEGLDAPVVLPLHPRTKKSMELHGLSPEARAKIRLVEPVGYLDMLALEKHAKKVLTDSGGVQKEAYILGTPCVTLREETEWVETLENHWNVLAGVAGDAILAAAKVIPTGQRQRQYGDGHAAQKIVEILLQNDQ